MERSSPLFLVWLENLSELYPRAEDPGFNGSYREPEEARDLVVLQSLQLVEYEGGPEGQRELHERALHKPLCLGRYRHVLQSSRPVRLRFVRLCRVAILAQLLRASLLSTQIVPRTVHRDPVEPGGEGGPALKRPYFAHHLEEYLLAEVLGVAGIAGHPVSEREHL